MRFFLFAFFLIVFSKSANAQCALLQNCTADTVNFCDYTSNDPLLWNEPYWLDPVHNSHDLYAGPASLSLAVRDSCGGGFSVRGVLYLDLDADGVRETAIDSDSTYTPGMVPFGNVTGTATLRNFDGRPVLAVGKYRFALRFDTTADVVTATMAWFNGNAYTTPELPAGVHRMEWYVTQDGATDTCAYVFTVVDCKNPTVVPINGLSANLQAVQGGMITLWASDFLLYAEDNATPNAQLQIGIRRSGTGTGFPVDAFGNPVTSLTFTCVDLGTNFVEIWARDANGNAGYGETYLLLQDNMGICGVMPPAGALTVCIETETVQGVEDVEIELDNPFVTGLPPIFFPWPWTANGNCYTFNQTLPLAASLIVTPHKNDDPLNGVSTFDLVLISRHILGVEPLNTPYKMIAADVNKSNSITTFDIVELRKLILGIYSEFPHNESWRFVDKDYLFPNAANPFAAPFPENVTIAELQQNGNEADFVGLKVGDVNGSALPNSLAPTASDDRTDPVVLTALSRAVRAGQIVELPFYSSDNFRLLGLQMELEIDPRFFEVLGVESVVLDEFSAAHYHILPFGGVRLSWNSARGESVSADAPLFMLRLRAKATGSSSEAVRLASVNFSSECYPADGGRRQFGLEFRHTDAGSLLQVGPAQPNPTAAGAELAVTLPRAGSVTLELWDATGRLVHRSQCTLDAGLHRLSLPAEAFTGAGLYTWRVAAGGEAVSGKVVRK